MFRKLTIDDLDYIDENLLPINKEEVKILTGKTFKEFCLGNESFMEASEVWEKDGKIITIFGGLPVEGELNIWLLCTKNILNYKDKFKVWTYKRLMREKKNYDIITSMVYMKNYLTKKWLKRLGFEIGRPQPIGRNGELFCRFEMR